MKKISWRTIVIIVVPIIILIGISLLIYKLVTNGMDENPIGTEEINVVFADVKAENKKAKAEISKDGKTLTFTTQNLKSVGETSMISYKVKNKGKEEVTINGIVCTAIGTYEDASNPTEEEKSKANENAANFSNYLTVGTSNRIAGKRLKSKKESETEELTVNMIREYKEKNNAIVYECVIDASK